MLLANVAYMLIDTSVMLVGVVFTIAIVMHIFSNDEKKAIQMLLSSLPYTRREIVSSKYISVFVYTLFVLSVTAIGHYAVSQQLPSWKELWVVVGIVMLFITFLYPFLYKFTSKYLLSGSIVIFAVYLVVVNLFVPNLNDHIRSLVAKMLAFNDNQILIGLGVVISILYLLSWLLSVKIYEKKVF